MGLQVNGRNVAAMRFNGRDAVEARCNGSVVWPVGEPPTDDRLRFVAEEAGSTITLTVVGALSLVPVLEYSLDAGETWTEFSCDNAPVITLANVGDTVWMRGENARFGQGSSQYVRFSMTGKIRAAGSIEYLRSKSGAVTALANHCYNSMFYGCTSLTTAPELPATTLANYCYYYMFGGCTSLTTVPELPAITLAQYCCLYMFGGCTSLTTAPELPATTLAHYCYGSMFDGCTSLTTAPELPATTLATYCYYQMFYGCTSLTTAPELPATTLATHCYYRMFFRCTSLTTAPELPATTLATRCYDSMFYDCTGLTTALELPATTLATYCCYCMFRGCTSLTTAPELPATTLADSCYEYMFRNCTSLTTAPELPATTLANRCYYYMFDGCRSLNYIHIAFDIWNPANATTSWVSAVAATGTFVCPEGLEQTVDTSHIPPGWVIQTYDPVWPDKPYIKLANGERIKVMEGTYDPDGPSYDPGGMIKIASGETCSLLYPDTRSAGLDLTYELQSGAKIVYTSGDAFRAYDKNGTLLALDQPLPDYPNTYNLSLVYTYANGLLLMAFWYSTPTYMRTDRKASSGVPGQGTALRNDTYYGLTDYYLAMLHDFAMGLLGGSQ